MDGNKFLEQTVEKVNSLLKENTQKSDQEVAEIKKSIEMLNGKVDTSELQSKISELENIVAKQGEMLKDKSEKQISFKDLLKSKESEFKNLLETKSGAVNLTLKTNVLRSSITSDTEAFRVDGISQLDYAPTAIEQAVNVRTIGANSHGILRYVDQETVTRSAATIAEGGAYPESAVTYKEYAVPLEKIGDSIPVSEEALKDVNYMQTELQRLLNLNLSLKLGNQIAVGDGISPNLTGVYTIATAFNSVGYAGTKAALANVRDLVVLLKNEIAKASNKYMPDTLVLNPVDELLILFAKDANGLLLFPDYSISGKIAGLKVVFDSNITAGTLLVGDFRYADLYTDGNIELSMNYVNDGFVKDLLTFKARKRALMLIRNADKGGFIKSTAITTDITNITA